MRGFAVDIPNNSNNQNNKTGLLYVSEKGNLLNVFNKTLSDKELSNILSKNVKIINSNFSINKH